MAVIYIFDDVKLKKQKEKVKDWIKQHEEAIKLFGPVIITGMVDLIVTLKKGDAVKEERKLKDDRIYDRKSGHYYTVKHIKSDHKRNAIYSEIDRRTENGERLYDILNDLNVMK